MITRLLHVLRMGIEHTWYRHVTRRRHWWRQTEGAESYVQAMARRQEQHTQSRRAK